MSEHTRREFLWRALPGAAVAGASLTLLRPVVSFAADPQRDREYVAAKRALEIDGQFAGWIESVQGGRAASDVDAGEAGVRKRQIGGVEYEDITVICGAEMSRGFYEWIKATLDKQVVRASGAVVTCDYNYKEDMRLEWTNALITEVGFPALDAASKDAAKMTIKFSPEMVRQAKGAGTEYSRGSSRAIQKKWLPSNFRLQIAGLEAACTRVSKIEAIVVKQLASAGSEARAVKGQAGLQASNLMVTVPERDAPAFQEWQRGGDRNNVKNGTLAYLAPDLREAFFTLTFQNLVVSRLTAGRVQAGSENIGRATVEMTYQGLALA